MSDASNYRVVMDLIAGGEVVDRVSYEAAVAFAKERKRKRPSAEAVVEEKPEKAASKRRQPRFCSEAGCDRKHYSGGFCSMHYTRRRREDPIQRAKANEASRAHRLRRADAEKEGAEQ